jgi:hypothetical protein
MYKETRCSACNTIVRNLSCACPGKMWKARKSVHVTGDENTMLEGKGFKAVRDDGGDLYYYRPGYGIIWLYPDDSWFTPDPDSLGLTLEAYLQKLPD